MAVSICVSVFEPVEIKYQNVKSDSAIDHPGHERESSRRSCPLYLPQQGRFLTESECPASARVCVLGFDLADILFPHTSPLGKEIRIGAEKFRSSASCSKRGQMFGQSRDNFVGMPITTLMKYFPYDQDEPGDHRHAPASTARCRETIEQITSILRQRRKVAFGKPNDFAVFTQDTHDRPLQPDHRGGLPGDDRHLLHRTPGRRASGS